MKRLLLASAAVALVGCEHNPETATIAANPRTAPQRTVTSFQDALRCMDDTFLARGIKDVFITSAGIPDATGQISAGTKDMLITAVATMSAKSGAFKFVDYDPTQIDVQVLSEMVGLRQDFVAPSYYLRGSITQLDQSTLSSSNAASVTTPFGNLGVSKDQVSSVISVDLNVGRLVTRQILPGLSSSNSIVVTKTGKGGDAGAVLGQGLGRTGVNFTVALDRNEGFSQAVRNLVELSAVETLGKLTRVPYWQCLNLDQTSPAYRNEARGWYDTMSEADKTKFETASLTRTGYLKGASGDAAVKEALSRYQADHNLIANGRFDFDTYYRLQSDEKTEQQVAALPPATTQLPGDTAPQTAGQQPAEPPVIEVRANKPRIKVGEFITAQALVSDPGYVYCYYQDAEGNIARVFPNQFAPDALVTPDKPVQIPPPGAGPNQFSLQPDKPKSKEALACVGAATELGLRLPDALKTKELTPLPVHGLKDIVDTFRKLGPVNAGSVVIEVL